MADFQYSICTEPECDEMVALLADVFARRDPPAVAVGLTPPEFEEFVRLLCPAAVRDGVTMLARHMETHELAGALLTHDSTSPMPDDWSALSPKFEPVFDILGRLETGYRTGPPPLPGEALHLFLLGVSGRFAGRGIARRLVEECLANGRKLGYRMAVTEATNRTSQHIFRKLGFVERVRQSYGEHRFRDRAFFASIAGEGGPMLMDKVLTQA